MINREQLKLIKETYKEGMRIKLLRMNDSQAPASGTIGTVTYVDDIGNIHMRWDTGSSLSLVLGEDLFDVIS